MSAEDLAQCAVTGEDVISCKEVSSFRDVMNIKWIPSLSSIHFLVQGELVVHVPLLS